MLRPELDPTRISAIRIRSFANAVALFPDMPETTSQAQYSLPFAVATMLVHGEIGVPQISGAGLRDADVARLVARTQLEVAPEHEARFPEGRWADLSITLEDGEVLQSGEVHARGGPEHPFSEADICAKFMDFAAPVLGPHRGGAVRDATLALACEDASFSTLTDLLTDPP